MSSILVVAAIDFGTTYSGYAFSFRDNPNVIQTNNAWNAGEAALLTPKTPTCVLVNPDGEFDTFGFEAENKYVELLDEGKHIGWRFFRRFKMLLHNNTKLTRDSEILDMNGKPMRALLIFSMAIRYLKDHMLSAICIQGFEMQEKEVMFVLTVPAIWDDSAKQFMREAAEMAGIDPTRLKLALEPEAASIWCETLGNAERNALAGARTQFMVVDLGGGTADISVHERTNNGTLREIHRPSGGPWGGTVVDSQYIDWLGEIFGTDAIAKLKQQNLGEYIQLLRDFEMKKRSTYKSTRTTLRASVELREISKALRNMSPEDAMSESMRSMVSLKGDKLRVESKLLQSWFEEPVDKVIQHVQGLLAKPDLAAVKTIILVGGFGESSYVKEKLKAAIKDDQRLIIPEDPALVVLKGAVRFGHESGVICSRKCKYTYGMAMKLPFDAKLHPAEKKKMIGGQAFTSDCFDAFVHSEEEVTVDQKFTQEYLPRTHFSRFEIFRSTEKNPKFTTDPGCQQLGTLQIRRPHDMDLTGEETLVTFMFGDTELLVKVRSLKLGTEEYKTIDCLSHGI